MTEKTKPSHLYAPKVSGNKRGRPRGQTDIGRLRVAVAERAQELVELLIARALAGDLGAASLLLSRVLAPLKPVEAAVSIRLPGTSLADDGRAVLAAVAAGALAPTQAAALIGAIGALGRVVDIEDIEAQVAELKAQVAAIIEGKK